MEDLIFKTELKGAADIFISHASNIDDIDEENAVVNWKITFETSKNTLSFDVEIINIELSYREVTWDDVQDTYVEKKLLILPTEYEIVIDKYTNGNTISIEDIDVDLIKKKVNINL